MTPGERAKAEHERQRVVGGGIDWDAIAQAARTEPDDNEPATVEWLLENGWEFNSDNDVHPVAVQFRERPHNPITRRQVRLLMEALG